MISQTQFNRLRLMYIFDLATSWSDGKTIINALLEGTLNPDWVRGKDVLNNYNKTAKRIGEFMKSDEKQMNLGCFGIRKTRKGAVIYANLARLKK
jgi:hypothetical protein